MVVYSYKCDECNMVYDLEEDPMNLPTMHKCPKCKKKMHRDWGSTQAVHIPLGFTDTKIRYNKSPSGRKHFYQTVK